MIDGRGEAELFKLACWTPSEDAACVANREQVLDVYQRPYDPQHPILLMNQLEERLEIFHPLVFTHQQ